MTQSASKPPRVPVRGKNWSKNLSIAEDKYRAVSRAILASLRKTPITLTEVVNRVKAKLESFPGSIAWYTITCLRELEVQGKVTRHPKPVRYSRR